ncbi:MAG: hypothetical protein KCHDKBKB_03085 [Elusimicrobia bacterium]|nr:hypothetical protein [Elusimicrobiota bacterium]
MKDFSRSSIAMFATVIALSILGSPVEGKDSKTKNPSPMAEDIVKESPQNAKVVFENEFASILEFRLKPGEKLPMHHGGDRVVYALNTFNVKSSEGEHTTVEEWQKGSEPFAGTGTAGHLRK